MLTARLSIPFAVSAGYPLPEHRCNVAHSGKGEGSCPRLAGVHMDNAQKSKILTILSVVSLAWVSLPAYAGPNGAAVHLLPLEQRQITAEIDHGRFRDAADEINALMGQDEGDFTDISDVIGSDVLDSFLDEDGNVNLPLGITVFSTLGDPSIGIGGDF